MPLMAILLVSLAAAQPPSLPLVVNGTVKIDDELAPVGTLVTAEMDGETVDYELTEPGKYGLSVPGTIGDYWKEVKFYVDGIPMDQTAKWKAGDIVNIDFSISEDSTSTSSSTTLPSGESTTTSTTSSSSSTTSSSTSTTLPETSSTTTPGTSTTSTSTLETTTSTVMAATSTVPTTIKPKADSGDGFSPKLFLLAILGIMLLLLLAVLAAMMKRH